MRKLGIDYGDARIGLAISDPMGIIATGLDNFNMPKVNAEVRAAEYILNIIKEKQVDEIAIGMPKDMSGEEGMRAKKTKEFSKLLFEKTGIKPFFIDERLTSRQGEKLLIEAGARRDKRKEVIDKVAACIILQSFLDRKR